MTLVRMPEVLSTVRLLNNDEIYRLKRQDGFYIPIPGAHPQPRCVTCKGNGEFKWYADYPLLRDEVVTYECDCRGQWRLYAAFLNSGIEWYYQTLGIPDLEGTTEESRALVGKFIQDFSEAHGSGLFLHGDRGTGKSLLSVIILKVLVERGVRCHYATFQTLIDKYAAGWDDQEDREWFIRRVKGAEILVIDDVGREQDTKIVGALLEEVLRHRVASGNHTIITSNKDPGWIAQRYGQHVRELMSETMQEHRFEGVSYRDDARRRREAELGLTRPIVVA